MEEPRRPTPPVSLADKIVDGASAVRLEGADRTLPQVLTPDQFKAVLATPVLRELHGYADRFVPLKRFVTGGATSINGVNS